MPALKPKPFAKDERIVKIKDLPAWMHPAFEGMDALNRIQSRVCCQNQLQDNMLLYEAAGLTDAMQFLRCFNCHLL